MHYWTLLCVVLEFNAVPILAVRQHFNYDRQPYGQRMCKDLCRRIVGCSHYVFTVSHLVCRVKNKKDAIAAERGQITKKTAGPSKECPWNTLVFYTRSGRPKCARVSEGPRLLVVQSQNLGRRGQVRQLDLGDGVAEKDPLFKSLTEKYLFINDDCIMAMAYVPSQRRILVATSKPFRIKSFVLDNYVSSTINKKWSAFGLCVDDSRQLVFFTAYRFNSLNCRISRMTTSGKGFRTILKDIRPASDITLDPLKMWIYFTQDKKIRRTNYHGQHVITLYRIDGFRGLTFDQAEHVLFFNAKGKELFQNVYFKNFLHMTSQRKLHPYNIVIHKKAAYVSSKSSNKGPLSYFSLKRKHSMYIKRVLDYKLNSDVILCLIT